MFAQLLGIDAFVLLSSVSPMPLIRFDASSNFIHVRDERKFIVYEKYHFLSSFPLSWVFKITTFLSSNFAFSPSTLHNNARILQYLRIVSLQFSHGSFNFGESWMHGMIPSDVTTFFPVKECSWAFISLTERERALFCTHWA